MGRFVEIYHIPTGKVEKSFDVTSKSERYIDQLISGIDHQIGDDYNSRIVTKSGEEAKKDT